MDQSLIRHFESYIKLNDNLLDALEARLHIRTFKKKEIVHHADNICTKSYFILQGLMRTYFLKDGKEITEYFLAEHEWVNSPRSMIQRTTDIYYIDTIEPTTVACLQVDDLGYLFDNFPEMEKYARLSMGSVFGHLMERITSIRFTSARERYDHFCRIYHDVYHRIPLGMIASYLGISQETLSRIRAGKE
ncbi:Crp/Fnr family transcriptional regulator [Chitinophaga pendula]|uniref:Crp/Fnr family transcriptional regulator n=1 Tax=Chitinophaga TaxID=79328 RepID=UPI000BB0C2E5|nr:MULTISPECIES: Crp/Fnr family transcriptional regulator [Chitinophaga]ASZ12059.1 hypothetical protein CK934_14360 [Chitinophaga sp. MD30]UCJ04907.1 Crp/Fnr family transcriptional regulator [Chitinophaga pendula]